MTSCLSKKDLKGLFIVSDTDNSCNTFCTLDINVAAAAAKSTGDLGSIPELGRSPGEGNGHHLQSSCLENPMDRGAWGATVHRVAKNWT